MGTWVIWLILAAVLGTIEIATTTLAFGLLGLAALVGRPAIVLEEVGPHSGRVRIGGEVWSARSYDETQVIPAGKTVDVMHIEGATALVYPRE